MNVFGKLLAICVCLGALYGPVEAATLTITVDGINTGAVGSQPGGQVCNSASAVTTCTWTFAPGTAIKLSADDPSTPGLFHDGTGEAAACAPTSTCAFVIQNDSSLTATFSAPGPSITIGLLGDGPGEVGTDNNRCQNYELGFSACTVYYAPGSQVTLVGRDIGGGMFAGFSGATGDAAGCAAASPCVFTLNTGASIAATFARLTSVAVQPPTPTTTVGQPQSFTATGTFTNTNTRTLFGGSGSGAWRTWTSMHDARFALAAGVLDQHVYAVGGVPQVCIPPGPCGFGPLATVEMYNLDAPPVGGTFAPWTFRASMLVPRESAAAAVLGGELYVLGGHTSGGGAVASVEAYNSASNSWTLKDPMPGGPRANLAAAVIGNTLYAVGGGDSAPLGTLEAYDLSTSAWTTLAPMPTPRASLAAVALNGLLYAIGGGNAVEAYNPADNTWSTKAPLPSFRSGLGAGVIDGLIYVIGGEAAPGTTQVYNPATNAWMTLAPMPTARNQFGLAVLDGRLFAAGGLTASNTPLATFESVRPPEATWWSSNRAVATIDSNAIAHSTSVGTTAITVRSVGIDCGATNGCATLTVAAGGGGGGGGGFFLNGPNSAFTQVGNPNWGCGSFLDQTAGGGPWSATVDYGDNSGVQTLPLLMPPAGPCASGSQLPTATFSFNHAYQSPTPPNASLSVTVTVTNTRTLAARTLTFPITVSGDNGGGGGDDGCALVTFNLAPGSATFAGVMVTVFDPETGNPLDDPFTASFGEALHVPAGVFGLRFTAPDGYAVTPTDTTVTVACGDDRSIVLNFAPLVPVVTITNPGAQNSAEGAAVTLAIAASDPGGDSLRFSAAHLPRGLHIDNASGVIAGTLTYNAAGSYAATVSVRDGHGGHATAAFAWTVTNSNRQPTLNAPAAQSDKEGKVASLQLHAHDADGDTLHFTVAGMPPGLVVDPATGLITGTPPYDAAGVYNVSATVTDGNGGSASAAFTWTILDANRAPSISGPGDSTHAEGDTVMFAATASDPDGDVVTFHSPGLPQGLQIDPASGIITGTLSYKSAGDYNITVTARDGRGGSASASFHLTVTDTNRPPALKTPAAQSDTAGKVASLQLRAPDPDGDVVTYEATSLPPGLSLDPSTGLIAGTPTTTGLYVVGISASDGQAPVSASFNWTVK